MRTSLLTFFCVVASATTLPATSQAASFRGLGFLTGATTSTVSGVSADGFTVVGASGPNNIVGQAFRWTNGGGMVGLGFLTGGTV